jgi:hypothetical protein
VWNEDEEEDEDMEWDDMAYIGEDPGLADEERERELAAMEALSASRTPTHPWMTLAGGIWI